MYNFTCQTCHTTLNPRDAANHECAPRSNDFATAAQQDAEEYSDAALGTADFALGLYYGHLRGAEWARNYIEKEQS